MLQSRVLSTTRLHVKLSQLKWNDVTCTLIENPDKTNEPVYRPTVSLWRHHITCSFFSLCCTRVKFFYHCGRDRARGLGYHHLCDDAGIYYCAVSTFLWKREEKKLSNRIYTCWDWCIPDNMRAYRRMIAPGIRVKSSGKYCVGSSIVVPPYPTDEKINNH